MLVSCSTSSPTLNALSLTTYQSCHSTRSTKLKQLYSVSFRDVTIALLFFRRIFLRLCAEIRHDVQPLTSASWGRRLRRLNSNEDLISGYRRRLNEACLSYLVASGVQTHHDVSRVKKEVSVSCTIPLIMSSIEHGLIL
jgi:hypothetical protein